jgi:hypothetical protein
MAEGSGSGLKTISRSGSTAVLSPPFLLPFLEGEKRKIGMGEEK